MKCIQSVVLIYIGQVQAWRLLSRWLVNYRVLRRPIKVMSHHQRLYRNTKKNKRTQVERKAETVRCELTYLRILLCSWPVRAHYPTTAAHAKTRKCIHNATNSNRCKNHRQTLTISEWGSLTSRCCHRAEGFTTISAFNRLSIRWVWDISFKLFFIRCWVLWQCKTRHVRSNYNHKRQMIQDSTTHMFDSRSLLRISFHSMALIFSSNRLSSKACVSANFSRWRRMVASKLS